MEKRGTTTELNREVFEADVDGYCSSAPSSNSTRPLTFLTKEEVLSSGRKLLRLKRTLTPSHFEPLQNNTKEALHDSTGYMPPISNCNENTTPMNLTLNSKNNLSDKPDNSNTTLGKDPKNCESYNKRQISPAISSETLCEKVKQIKTLQEKTPLQTESETICSSNLHDEKSIENQDAFKSVENANPQVTLDSINSVNSSKNEELPKPSGITEATKDSTVSNEAQNNLTNVQHQTREASIEDKIHFFTKDQVTTHTDKDIKLSSGSSTECQPILGNFFNKQFTNPFAETAKQGEDKFSASQSFLSSMQPKETILGPTTDLIDNDDPCRHLSNDTTCLIQFPGEEDDVELFSDRNVILLKCVPVKVETTELSESKSGTEHKFIHKFKRQGEGVLRLLQRKNEDAESDDTKQTRRLVFRQRGTFTLLLNSPLWISKTFDKIPELTGGFGVRFVGINPLVSKEGNQVAFESYILKFKLEKQRADFLDAVKKYQIV